MAETPRPNATLTLEEVEMRLAISRQRQHDLRAQLAHYIQDANRIRDQLREQIDESVGQAAYAEQQIQEELERSRQHAIRTMERLHRDLELVRRNALRTQSRLREDIRQSTIQVAMTEHRLLRELEGNINETNRLQAEYRNLTNVTTDQTQMFVPSPAFPPYHDSIEMRPSDHRRLARHFAEAQRRAEDTATQPWTLVSHREVSEAQATGEASNDQANALRKCTICWETCPEENTIRPSCCMRTLCMDCVLKMFRRALTDRDAMPARCCKLLQLGWVRDRLSDEEIQRYKERFEEVIMNHGGFYCTNKHCDAFISKATIDGVANDKLHTGYSWQEDIARHMTGSSSEDRYSEVMMEWDMLSKSVPEDHGIKFQAYQHMPPDFLIWMFRTYAVEANYRVSKQALEQMIQDMAMSSKGRVDGNDKALFVDWDRMEPAQVYVERDRVTKGFKVPVPCPKCTTLLCTSCHMAAHESLTCPVKEEDTKILDQVRDMGYKRCPGCGTGVRRMYGCSHVRCAFCRMDWCWGCGQTMIECGGGCSAADEDEYEEDYSEMEGENDFDDYEGDEEMYDGEGEDEDRETDGSRTVQGDADREIAEPQTHQHARSDSTSHQVNQVSDPKAMEQQVHHPANAEAIQQQANQQAMTEATEQKNHQEPIHPAPNEEENVNLDEGSGRYWRHQVLNFGPEPDELYMNPATCGHTFDEGAKQRGQDPVTECNRCWHEMDRNSGYFCRGCALWVCHGCSVALTEEAREVRRRRNY